MSEPIKPALTKEEWAEAVRQYESDRGLSPHRAALGNYALTIYSAYREPYAHVGNAHQCAALCLYQQPFGFTQEDAEILRQIAPFVVGSTIAQRDLRAWAHRLADRIAALLPPSDSEAR